MEFLATFGMAAKNMFDYNRENFQFDQEQRLSRELLRQILQLKRFTLFREDIRDLVELTVGKMEMYHLVAALFMESSMALYFEGRIHHVAPPFILSLLYISIASAFMYLLLAVWLSMHASICSHSFGVRLLTRFVRLPVPGMQQMGVLNARLADFERQGVQGMLRVPVIGGRQDWMQRQPLQGVPEDQQNPDLLGEGIKAWNKEDNIMGSAQGALNKHVDLFRRLQCKWQCFDAYARVCMALGANQLVLGLQYYLVITTLIQYRCPSVCLTLLAGFCSGGLALAYLDLAGLGGRKICLLQLMGSIPVWIAAISIIAAKKSDEGIPLVDNAYRVSPVAFFLNILWFEGLLWVAWPSEDEATLPRLFRSVIFLDVFEDVGMDEDGEVDSKQLRRQGTVVNMQPAAPLEKEDVKSADKALFLAHAALRRWEATAVAQMPGCTDQMKSDLAQYRHRYVLTRGTFLGEMSKRFKAGAVLQEDQRPWEDLDEDEKEDDPFGGSLLGPFTTHGRTVYYNLEAGETEEGSHSNLEILTLDEVQSMVDSAESKVRRLLGRHVGSQSSSETDSDSSDGPQRGRSFIAGNTGGKWLPTGEHHIQRLPWKVLYYNTRSLQVAWLIMFVINLMEQCGMFLINVQTMDMKEIEEHQEEEDIREVINSEIEHGEAIEGPPDHHRRLFSIGAWSSPSWSFQRWPIQWPQPAIFKAEAMHCRSGTSLPLLSTSYKLFKVVRNATLSKQRLELEELNAKSFPASSVMICDSEAKEECLQAALTTQGLRLWSSEVDTTVQITGKTWRRVAGVQAPCESLEPLLRASPVGRSWTGRCLLLAGWDGSRLPVAVLPWPSAGATVSPIVDAPLTLPGRQVRPRGARDAQSPSTATCAAEGSTVQVKSLSLEASALRLWALQGQDLWGWDLLHGRVLGRWTLPDFRRGFEATAICAGSGATRRPRLMLAGRIIDDGRPGPELLVSKIPDF